MYYDISSPSEVYSLALNLKLKGPIFLRDVACHSSGIMWFIEVLFAATSDCISQSK